QHTDDRNLGGQVDGQGKCHSSGGAAQMSSQLPLFVSMVRLLGQCPVELRRGLSQHLKEQVVQRLWVYILEKKKCAERKRPNALLDVIKNAAQPFLERDSGVSREEGGDRESDDMKGHVNHKLCQEDECDRGSSRDDKCTVEP